MERNINSGGWSKQNMCPRAIVLVSVHDAPLSSHSPLLTVKQPTAGIDRYGINILNHANGWRCNFDREVKKRYPPFIRNMYSTRGHAPKLSNEIFSSTTTHQGHS
jgi:hypothetical protein